MNQQAQNIDDNDNSTVVEFHLTTKVSDMIRKASQDLDVIDNNADELKGKYTEANKKFKAQREEIISQLEAGGVNRHAFKFAREYISMSEEVKSGLDESYAFSRTALGQPIQDDMFTE